MSDDEREALIAEARRHAEALINGTETGDADLLHDMAYALEDAQETIAAFIIGGAAHPADERAWEYRRVDPRGFVRPVVFDVLPALDEGWTAERRAIGPWSPVPEGSETA